MKYKQSFMIFLTSFFRLVWFFFFRIEKKKILLIEMWRGYCEMENRINVLLKKIRGWISRIGREMGDEIFILKERFYC